MLVGFDTRKPGCHPVEAGRKKEQIFTYCFNALLYSKCKISFFISVPYFLLSLYCGIPAVKEAYWLAHIKENFLGLGGTYL